MSRIARTRMGTGGIAIGLTATAILAAPLVACAQNQPKRPIPPQAREAELPAATANAGDINDRLARIEQQLERLTQEIAALHSIIGDPRELSRTELPTPSERKPADTKTADATRPNAARETKPAPPANMHLRDRWNTDVNRFGQGDLSAARQRGRTLANQRADRANVAAQQQANQREADEFVRRSQPGPLPPGNTNPRGQSPARNTTPNATNTQNSGNISQPSDDENIK